MKRFSEQLNKKANSIKMRTSERRDLRERLVSYMEYHPLPAEMKSVRPRASLSKGLLSEPFTLISFNTTYVRGFIGAFAMLLIVVVPAVAENSLPGDVLYPVKVQFNEEVRSSLTLSPYKKVEWETERLERRISEARLLAKEGKLTDDVEEDVTEAVKAQTSKAQKEIALLGESDTDEAAIAGITLASALAVQSEVLEGDLETESGLEEQGDGRSIAKIATAVAEAQRSTAASQGDSNPSYEKLLARVEEQTTRSYELFSSIEEYASKEEKTDIQRRLADIERKVQAAVDLHEAKIETILDNTDESDLEDILDGESEANKSTSSLLSIEFEVSTEEENLAEANALLRTALTDSRKLISFMTNIDVRESVTVEDLVPATPTNDEKTKVIKNTLNKVTEIQTIINRRAVITGASEKFTIGADRVDTLVTTANSSLSQGKYETAGNKSKEALVLITDLLSLTREAGNEPVIEDKNATTTEDILEDGRIKQIIPEF